MKCTLERRRLPPLLSFFPVKGTLESLASELPLPRLSGLLDEDEDDDELEEELDAGRLRLICMVYIYTLQTICPLCTTLLLGVTSGTSKR